MEMGNDVFLSGEQTLLGSNGIDTSRLEIISEELSRLINAIGSSPAKQVGNFISHRLKIAKSIVADRAKRSQIFDKSFFGEPAWDILLNLYIAGRESRRVTISEACIASLVPGSTALRFIQFLVERDMIIKTTDGRDKRRVHVTLTSAAHDKMENYLDAVHAYPVSSFRSMNASIAGAA